MQYIKKPYLPEKKAVLFIADAEVAEARCIKPPRIDVLPEGISRHADLGICIISEKLAVCSPESSEYYRNALSPFGFEIIKGKSHLGCNYPQDCAYNVGIAENKCFMNREICDRVLLSELEKNGYEIIHTKQGYAKCSICSVGQNSLITGDISIYKAAVEKGMNVLLVSNDDIILKGYKNGFFGGCCGMESSDTLIINGELSKMRSGKEIEHFLSELNIKVKSIKKGAVCDIGSIIPLMTSDT